MTGRAKWDAWSSASNAYGDHREKAEKRYLEIARDLGWTEGFASSGFQNQSYTESDKVTGSWTSYNNESGSNRGEGGGMGTSVSAMAPPPLDDQDARSFHGLAVANKASELSSYLDASPGDINKLDEHGYTALHLACDRGNAAVVELLLHRGADYSLTVRKFAIFELATVAGHDDIVALIENSR
ncbi:hypothetical protein PILCRDRAFT_827296 [Piloderma croceum F 1598]|uniref:Uncharacterized protein n=1 Tax=Piloderma croceum (strain F 1598) TaxID=765440 RepID=A0A0C3ES29_PILCF|nr:hypothetical protein PILCRDRAFT_827296 [Piloderma croceum F 1598]